MRDVWVLWLAVAGCTAPADSEVAMDTDVTPVRPGIVHLALSVHVEGFRENQGTPDERLAKYAGHVARLDAFSEAWAAHGAKITYEAELPYLIGEDVYLRSTGQPDRTTLAERVAAGHFAAPHSGLYGETKECPKVYAEDGSGVGPYSDATTQCPEGIASLQRLKDAFTGVGLSAPTYVSGVCSEADWLAIAGATGFRSIGGTVGWCAKTMSPEALAAMGPEYAVIHGGTCTNPAACHQQMPLDPTGRWRSWGAADASNWLVDTPNAAIRIIPSTGDPRCAAEEAASPDSQTSCTFDDGDIAPFFAELDAVVAAAADGRDRSFVITVSVGGAASELADVERFRTIAQRMDADYVQAGTAIWSSTMEAGAIPWPI